MQELCISTLLAKKPKRYKVKQALHIDGEKPMTTLVLSDSIGNAVLTITTSAVLSVHQKEQVLTFLKQEEIKTTLREILDRNPTEHTRIITPKMEFLADSLSVLLGISSTCTLHFNLVDGRYRI